MRLTTRHWGIKTKLFFMNTLILLMLGAIIVVVFLSFHSLRKLTTTIIQSNMARVVENARSAQEITSIFAGLLTSIFYGTEMKDNSGMERLQRMIAVLSEQGESPKLRTSMTEFSQHLTTLLAQSARMKTMERNFSDSENDIIFELDIAGELVAERLENSEDIEPLLARHLGNIQGLVSANHESFLQITKQATDLRHALSQRNASDDGQAVNNAIDFLILRIETFKQSGGEIAAQGDQIIASLEAYKKEMERFKEDIQAFHAQFDAVSHSKDQVIEALKERDEAIGHVVGAMQRNIQEGIQSSINTVALLMVVILVILAFTTYSGARMVNPLIHLARTANQIAQGNIRVQVEEIHSQDEIGMLSGAFRTMVQHIQEVVRNVKTAIDNTRSSSVEMNEYAGNLLRGVNSQAASAEEVSASMEQMVANIRQAADNAGQTEDIALRAAEKAEGSSRVVGETVDAMKIITKKILIIQDIADRTRMLSLNAAIEAARAHDHGKPFSVVADEVRKLSDMARVAATEINGVAHASVDIAENAGRMLNTLVPEIHETARLTQDISLASKEQRVGAEQVNLAIQELDRVTQENTLIADKIASNAEELSSQASRLQEVIAFFKFDEEVAKPAGDTPA